MTPAKPKIALVDYAAGNLRSMQNALSHLCVACEVVESPEGLEAADGIVLPGVGNFGYAVGELKRRGLYSALRDLAGSKPLLGICLGMQLLLCSSEESPGATGLSIIEGDVKRLEPGHNVKVPNMGWCAVSSMNESLLLPGSTPTDFYFAHSYVCKPPERDARSWVREGSIQFVASIERPNVFGVQFHPEKSGPEGLKLLQRFLALASGRVKK